MRRVLLQTDGQRFILTSEGIHLGILDAFMANVGAALSRDGAVLAGKDAHLAGDDVPLALQHSFRLVAAPI